MIILVKSYSKSLKTKSKKGDFEGAIKTYTYSFEGFTRDYALKVLKNEAVIVVTDNGAGINLIDDEDHIKENAELIVDWNYTIKKILETLNESCLFIDNIKNKVHIDLNDYCLNEIISVMDDKYMDPVYTLVARYISGEKLNLSKFPVLSHLISKGDDSFYSKYVDDEMTAREKKAYAILKYVDCIKIMHREFITLDSLYNSLLDNGFIQRVPKFEDTVENVLINNLIPFCNTDKGYHHPLCDEQIIKLKESMYDDISNTSIGKEYIENGIIAKNILDGYDAGFLSPDGTFYGMDGNMNELLHVQLIDMLSKKLIESKDNHLDKEYELMKKGYMKIHNDNIYGFYGPKDDKEMLYCPTEKQIELICQYANKFYGGKINTASTPIESNIISTSALKQMDEVALHNAFRF